MRIDSLDWVIDGLLPGSFRGITFSMPDTSSSVGRRVVEYLFPGVDAADYDDFGLSPNEISVTGLILGDDYKLQATALQAAFETPGPATLIHPWLGPMMVIMAQPGQISFSEKELRLVRFTATFKRLPLTGSSAIGGLSGLISAIDTVVSVASALTSIVGSILSATRTKSVTRSTRIVTSAIGAVTAPSGSARALPQLKAAIGASVPSSPADFDTLIRSTSALINTASIAAAVAPAAEAVIPPAPTALSLMSIGMTVAEALTASVADAPADADRALLISAAAQFLAQAAAQSAYAEYTSSQQALAFRARTTDAADGMSAALETITASSFQADSTALRRGIRQLQSALIADINQTIGRLPSVLTFRPDRPLDAWLLAQHVFGDAPSTIEAGYLDIVARNNPRHPAALPSGPVEVLGQ